MSAAEAAAKRAGFALADMEYFPARDGGPADVCREYVRGCDIYVGIIGFRYGSPVRDEPHWSYTQLEFAEALDAQLERLVFVLDDDLKVAMPRRALVDDEHGYRQEIFRNSLQDGARLTVARVCDPRDLELGLCQALTQSPTTLRGSFSGRPGPRPRCP